MKSKSYLRWFVLLISCLLLVNCVAPAKPTATQPSQVQPSQLAKATSNKPVTTKETGAVVLQLIDNKSGRPIAQQDIFLAELLQVHGQLEGAYIPSLDMVSAPKAVSDDQGNVIISGAKPNKYAVTLLTPLGPILLQDLEAGKDLLVEVKAGEITNIGSKKVGVPDYLMNP